MSSRIPRPVRGAGSNQTTPLAEKVCGAAGWCWVAGGQQQAARVDWHRAGAHACLTPPRHGHPQATNVPATTNATTTDRKRKAPGLDSVPEAKRQARPAPARPTPAPARSTPAAAPGRSYGTTSAAPSASKAQPASFLSEGHAKADAAGPGPGEETWEDIQARTGASEQGVLGKKMAFKKGMRPDKKVEEMAPMIKELRCVRRARTRAHAAARLSGRRAGAHDGACAACTRRAVGWHLLAARDKADADCQQLKSHVEEVEGVLAAEKAAWAQKQEGIEAQMAEIRVRALRAAQRAQQPGTGRTRPPTARPRTRAYNIKQPTHCTPQSLLEVAEAGGAKLTAELGAAEAVVSAKAGALAAAEAQLAGVRADLERATSALADREAKVGGEGVCG